MSQGTGKALLAEMKSAVRQGFKDRRWRPVRGDSASFEAPEETVSEPLNLRVSVAIELNKFGDVTLTGDAMVRCESIIEELTGFDRGSLPSDVVRWPGDEAIRLSMYLALETAGSLLDPGRGGLKQWEAASSDEVQEAARDFFAMIDDSLAQWMVERQTPQKLLGTYGLDRSDATRKVSSRTVRTVSILALMQGRIDFARKLLASYQEGLGDDPERFALFEREVALRYPDYGQLQQS